MTALKSATDTQYTTSCSTADVTLQPETITKIANAPPSGSQKCWLSTPTLVHEINKLYSDIHSLKALRNKISTASRTCRRITAEWVCYCILLGAIATSPEGSDSNKLQSMANCRMAVPVATKH